MASKFNGYTANSMELLLIRASLTPKIKDNKWHHHPSEQLAWLGERNDPKISMKFKIYLALTRKKNSNILISSNHYARSACRNAYWKHPHTKNWIFATHRETPTSEELSVFLNLKHDAESKIYFQIRYRWIENWKIYSSTRTTQIR